MHLSFFPARWLTLASAAAVVLLPACDSGDSQTSEPAVITRAVIHLSRGLEDYVFTASDADGDGADMDVESITLSTGASYTGSVAFFDDQNGTEVTADIREQAAHHQVFYELSDQLSQLVLLTVDDTDENDLPLGLRFTLTTGGGSGASGTLRLVLSRFDNAVKDGTTRGETSAFDVDFPVAIERVD
jgi:hypothetical protein